MVDYEKHLAKVFDTSKMVVHYQDWFNEMSVAEFLKLQQMFSVAQMIERDNFSKRYKNGDRIGLHEFSYALLQGYDSVAMKADIEIGGTDQLFNLLAGRTVQKAYGLEPQNIVTYELLLGLDGRKMSTSWGNCIYIDDEPSDMYGKVMSISDDLMWDYFRVVTEVEEAELAAIKQQLDGGQDPRGLKAKLAYEITKIYHGEAAAKAASEEFDSQFVKKQLPEDPQEITTRLGARDLVELLSETGLVDSNSEARRMIEQGAVKLNQEKIEGPTVEIAAGDVLQVGKRRFARVKA
jgi:tyrosyl-tRNA synthetase